MIDFRHRENIPASLLAIVAILVMAGTLAFMLFYPTPTNKGLAAKVRKERLDIQLKTQSSQQRLAASQATISANTWPGKGDDVAPSTNARLSAFAARRGIKLTGFRPQRAAEVDRLNTLPFLVTVEGPFPQVLGFTQDIDSPGTRLTVNLLQVTAAADASDRVTATVGVSAYLRPERTAPTPSRTAGSRTAEPRPSAGGTTNRA